MDYAEKRREQGRETERAILEAAIALSHERGFDKVSIRDICAKAGITTGAFYHHFSSKEELLSRGFRPMDAYMEELLSGHAGAPALERLRLLLMGYAAFMEDMGCALVGRYYEHRLSAPASASMDATRYIHTAMLACLEDIGGQGGLAAGVTPGWVAELLYRHFRGTVIDWVLSQGAYSLLPKLEQDYLFFQQALEAPVK